MGANRVQPPFLRGSVDKWMHRSAPSPGGALAMPSRIYCSLPSFVSSKIWQMNRAQPGQLSKPTLIYYFLTSGPSNGLLRPYDLMKTPLRHTGARTACGNCPGTRGIGRWSGGHRAKMTKLSAITCRTGSGNDLWNPLKGAFTNRSRGPYGE